MVMTTCDTCGRNYHWSWEEAFDKFGSNNGGQLKARQVEAVLVEAGYDVIVMRWALHNIVITSIERDGQELMPQDGDEFCIGHDCPRDYLPAVIVDLLDHELPSAG